MDVKRGLFRLWLVLSAIWMCGVAFDAYGSITAPYVPAKEYRYIAADKNFVPQFQDKDPLMWLNFGNTHDAMDFPHNLTAYVPAGMSRDDKLEVARRFAAEILGDRAREVDDIRWQNLTAALELALLPVAFVYVLGAALLWAFAGFRKSRA